MDLSKLSDKKLMDQYIKACYQEEQAVAEKMEIREEFKKRLTKAKLNSNVVGDYSILKYKKITFKTELAEAEVLGAVKKTKDTKVLRSLYDKGVKVPGVVESVQVAIRRVK